MDRRIKKLLLASEGVTTAGSSAQLIWQLCMPDDLPDALKGFVFPPRIIPGIFVSDV